MDSNVQSYGNISSHKEQAKYNVDNGIAKSCRNFGKKLMRLINFKDEIDFETAFPETGTIDLNPNHFIKTSEPSEIDDFNNRFQEYLKSKYRFPNDDPKCKKSILMVEEDIKEISLIHTSILQMDYIQRAVNECMVDFKWFTDSDSSKNNSRNAKRKISLDYKKQISEFLAEKGKKNMFLNQETKKFYLKLLGIDYSSWLKEMTFGAC